MGAKVLVGGFTGGLLGLCAIPFVGPLAAVPIATSLSGVGASIGWKVSLAKSVQEISNSTEDIRKTFYERSNEAVRVFEKAEKVLDILLKCADKVGESSYHSMVEIGKKISILMTFILLGVVDTGGMAFVHFLNNQKTEGNCHRDFFCENVQTLKFLTTLGISISLWLAIGKVSSMLWKESEVNPTATNPENKISNFKISKISAVNTPVNPENKVDSLEKRVEILEKKAEAFTSIAGPIGRLESPLREQVAGLMHKIDKNEHFNPYDYLSKDHARDLCYQLWKTGSKYISIFWRLDFNWGQHAFQYQKYKVAICYKREALLTFVNNQLR